METLIIKNNVNPHWYPQTVEKYKRSIKVPYDTPENYRLNSNFAYSMQYIEYLEKQINELILPSVLKKMIYKSYIITGMGIIELLLVYRLKTTNNWNTTEWLEINKFVANSKEIEGVVLKTETVLYKKVDQTDMRMDLDSMIKKAERKHIFSIDHNVFPALKQLRELRNRVHLQIGEDSLDHDYNRIHKEEVQMMRRILYAVLTAPEICNHKSTFDFINESYIINEQ